MEQLIINSKNVFQPVELKARKAFIVVHDNLYQRLKEGCNEN